MTVDLRGVVGVTVDPRVIVGVTVDPRVGLLRFQRKHLADDDGGEDKGETEQQPSGYHLSVQQNGEDHAENGLERKKQRALGGWDVRKRDVLDAERDNGREDGEEDHACDNGRRDGRQRGKRLGRRAEKAAERSFRDELEHREDQNIVFARELRNVDHVQSEQESAQKRHGFAVAHGEGAVRRRDRHQPDAGDRQHRGPDVEDRGAFAGDDPPQEGDDHAIGCREKRVDAGRRVLKTHRLAPKRGEVENAEDDAGDQGVARERATHVLPNDGEQKSPPP